MRHPYFSPQLIVINVYPAKMLCLSLTGGTEPMNQSDLEDIIIDDPFAL